MLTTEIAIDKLVKSYAKDEIENPSSHRIKKRISQFEKEIKAKATNYSRRPSSPPIIPNRHIKFDSLEKTFMSQSSSNTNLSSYVNQRHMFPTTEKFKSCSNLRNSTTISSNKDQNPLSIPPIHRVRQHTSPGALVVKQMFIEPPKRITRSLGHSKSRSVDCDFHFYDTFEFNGNICNR